MTQPKVLIVGAGPAGIRAAEALVKAGITPLVVDEAPRAGGQIYRRPPKGFQRAPKTLYGSEAHKARALHDLFDHMVAAKQVVHLPQSSVVSLSHGQAHIVGPNGHEVREFSHLILATGAMDRMAPVPGWEMGGVYSLGAAQIALKSQGVALGRQIVLAGSGPLLTLVASQLIKAGGNVVAVLETASWRAQIRGGVRMGLARPIVSLRGLMLRFKLGRRYHAGVHLERITGEDGPKALSWRDAKGQMREVACDMVGLGWHLRAETHLSDLAGAAFTWDETFQQWLPETDAYGRAGPNLYLAGDGMKVLGADGAEIAGRLAALACLQDLGKPAPNGDKDLRARRRMIRFAKAVAMAFPWPQQAVQSVPDETVLCRCEGITAGALRDTIDRSGPEANRAKSLGRVGMGRCQGRYCQLAGAEVMASATGHAPCDMGRLRSQPPVRPVLVAHFDQDSPEPKSP